MSQSSAQEIPQEIPQENTEKELTSDRDSDNAELSTVGHQVKLNDMCVAKVETSDFPQDAKVAEVCSRDCIPKEK